MWTGTQHFIIVCMGKISNKSVNHRWDWLGGLTGRIVLRGIIIGRDGDSREGLWELLVGGVLCQTWRGRSNPKTKMVNKIYMQADKGQSWRLRVLKSFLVCFLSWRSTLFVPTMPITRMAKDGNVHSSPVSVSWMTGNVASGRQWVVALENWIFLIMESPTANVVGEKKGTGRRGNEKMMAVGSHDRRGGRWLQIGCLSKCYGTAVTSSLTKGSPADQGKEDTKTTASFRILWGKRKLLLKMKAADLASHRNGEPPDLLCYILLCNGTSHYLLAISDSSSIQ